MALLSSTTKAMEAHEKRQFLKKTIGKMSNREAVLLRNLLNSHLEGRLSHIQLVNIKEGLINSLYVEENVLEMVEENLLTVKSIILPDESFEWLYDNARVQFTCLSILKEIRDYEGQLGFYGNTIFNQFQSYLDSIVYSQASQPQQPNVRKFLALDEKVKVLEKVKSIYDQIRNSDNYSKWLKAGEEHQIQWTRNYLQELNLYLGIVIDQEDFLLVRDIILTSLDLVKYSSGLIDTGEYIPSPEKTLFVDKMKRAWSQQKYRDAGKTKKPYHLPLTKNTKDRLEKMAQVKGLSETAMLDILINRSYEIGYVDIDDKDIY